MSVSLVDANVILRLVLNDNPKQVEKARQLFLSSTDVFIPDLIVAECVWVLTSLHKIPKTQICSALGGIFDLPAVKINSVIRKAFGLYLEKSIDFVDAYLAATAELHSVTIYSFDQDFKKVDTIQVKQPGT